MLKSLHRLIQCRRNRFLRRRLAGLNPTGKTLAQQADRTEFHCSRKLVAAARAGALGLCAHSPNRSVESNTTLPPSSAKSASTSLANCCPGPRTIAYCNMLACQMTFWKGIPAARLPQIARSVRHQGYRQQYNSALPQQVHSRENLTARWRKRFPRNLTRRFPTRLLRLPIQNDMVRERRVQKLSRHEHIHAVDLLAPRPRSGKYGNSWLCPETKYFGR